MEWWKARQSAAFDLLKEQQVWGCLERMETSALFLHWSPSLATVAVDVSTAGCLTTARRLAVEDLLLWQVAIKKPWLTAFLEARQSAAFDLLKGTERSPTKFDFNEFCNCFPKSGLFKSIWGCSRVGKRNEKDVGTLFRWNLFHCFHARWGQEIVAFPMGNHWPSWWIFQPV